MGKAAAVTPQPGKKSEKDFLPKSVWGECNEREESFENAEKRALFGVKK